MKTFFCIEAWKDLTIVTAVLTIITILACVITLQVECLYALCFIMVFPIILFLFRKTFFAKIQLTDEGISKIYRNKVIKHIKWEDLEKIVAVQKRSLFFLDEPISKKEFTTKYTSLISFSLTTKKIETFMQYKKFIKCDIEDIEVLGARFKQIWTDSQSK